MRNIIVLIVIVIGFSSCHRLLLTESYLKNNIEKHTIGENSTIKAFLFDNNVAYDQNAIVEVLGYKYRSEKGLLIGVTHSLSVKNQNQNILFLSNNNVIELSVEQCKFILQLRDTIDATFKSLNTESRERKSTDYTISKDLIISYSNIRTGKAATNNSVLDLWINNKRYTVHKVYFYEKIEKFIEY